MASIAASLAAVALATYVGLSFRLSAPLLLIGIVSVACLIIVYRSSFKVVRVGLLCLTCLLLVFRANSEKVPDDFISENFGGDQEIVIVVDSPPRETSNSTQIITHHIESIEGEEGAWVGGIQATLPRYAPINYGDRIRLIGQLKTTREVADPGYRSYLLNHQVYGTMMWPDVQLLETNKGVPMIAAGLAVQQAANRRIQSLLPRDAASFVSGVLLGSKQELSEEFDGALKKTGTTHVIVASGYNISIIISLVLILLKHQRNITKTLLALVTILCYLFISGLDPSIVRASIMASLILYSNIIGRQKDSLYVLYLTGVIMLIIQPIWLLDTGFQLSFLATLGIILMQPKIASQLKFCPGWLSETLSTTLAAQIFVLPVIATTFGSISTVSLVTNTLIGWVIPIIMFMGGLLLISSLVFEFVAGFLANLLYPFFYYVKQTILLTAKVPFASLSRSFSWVGVLAYYSGLLLIIVRGAKANE